MSYKGRTAESSAKHRLTYYFGLIADRAGVVLDSDCRAEIEGIVDDIMIAAVEETKRQLVEKDKGGGSNETY